MIYSALKLPTRPIPAQQRKELLADSGELTDAEIDLILTQIQEEQSSLLGAGLGRQTFSRYFVEHYLSKYKWYNPNRDNPDLSLAKGWAYFEHFTLPRRFVTKSGGHHVRAPPGETRGEMSVGFLSTSSLRNKLYVASKIQHYYFIHLCHS
jgi:hypothetical protein